MTYVVLLLLTPKMLSLPFDFLKTMTSCPGLTDKLHSTIDLITGSAGARLLIGSRLPTVGFSTSGKGLSPNLRLLSSAAIVCSAASQSDDI